MHPNEVYDGLSDWGGQTFPNPLIFDQQFGKYIEAMQRLLGAYLIKSGIAQESSLGDREIAVEAARLALDSSKSIPRQLIGPELEKIVKELAEFAKPIH